MFYKLKPSMRKEFSKHLGKLFKGNPDVSFPEAIKWMNSQFRDLFDGSSKEKPPIVIGVGDVVSISILQNKFLRPLMKYLFIDGESQRGRNQFMVPILKNSIKKTFYNPAGFINKEIFEFLSQY